MISPAYALALYLQSRSVGTFAADLFCAVEPAEPDNCLTCYDTGGTAPTSGWSHHCDPLFNTTVQVRSRNASYESGYKALHDVRNEIMKLDHYTTNGTMLIGARASTDIFALPRDDSGRYIHTINLDIKAMEA